MHNMCSESFHHAQNTTRDLHDHQPVLAYTHFTPPVLRGVCKLRKEGPRKGPAWPMAQAPLHCPAQAASASFCPARSGPAAPQSPPRPRDGAFPDSDTVWQCEAVVALGRSPGSPKERRGPPSLREWGTGLFGDLEVWVAPGRRSLRGKLGLR